MEAIEKFGLDRVNRFVLEKHHLTEDSKINDIYQIAQDICGLHATHPMTPYLSLFIRTRKFREKIWMKFFMRREGWAKFGMREKPCMLFRKKEYPRFFPQQREC